MMWPEPLAKRGGKGSPTACDRCRTEPCLSKQPQSHAKRSVAEAEPRAFGGWTAQFSGKRDLPFAVFGGLFWCWGPVFEPHAHGPAAPGGGGVKGPHRSLGAAGGGGGGGVGGVHQTWCECPGTVWRRHPAGPWGCIRQSVLYTHTHTPHPYHRVPARETP